MPSNPAPKATSPGVALPRPPRFTGSPGSKELKNLIIIILTNKKPIFNHEGAQRHTKENP